MPEFMQAVVKKLNCRYQVLVPAWLHSIRFGMTKLDFNPGEMFFIVTLLIHYARE